MRTVDKIMYRGNNYITLTLDKWSNENAAFLGNNGSALSDHPPTASTFSWTSNPDLHLSNTFGGPHDTRFTDIALAAAGQTVALSLCMSESVAMVWSFKSTLLQRQQGSGGTYETLNLAAGEYITSMEVHWGKKSGHTRVFYLNFVTSAGISVSGGTMTDDKATVQAPEGFQLSGFHGRSGDEINALGAIFTRVASGARTQEA
ncbi:unnamed protein product [Phytophthora lilii]|uniref:Unnamed protein product n=1 Tax=Phytophthora lilii TaxID=2077276 RepID=A0A9W6WUN0_9STRA|nr:unnamed protein product [Phytophthora lilii]